MNRFADQAASVLATTVVLLCGANIALAVDSPETWVEPALTDCYHSAVDTPGTEEIAPETFLFNQVNATGLDSDGNEGSQEDSDTPAEGIYGSLDLAVQNTKVGGTVYLAMRGVYRDDNTVTIEDDLTIHGFADRDVILSGADCIDSANSAATALTVNIASSEVVVLENLDFRNYTTAIDVSGSTGGTLIVRNCKFLDNTTHISDDGGGPEIHVIGSTFVGGSYGIREAKGLTVLDSTFDGQATNAIEGTFAQDWRLVSSRIANCGGISISAQGAGTGTHDLEISDSFIVDGGGSGIDIEGVAVTFSLHRSTVSGNAGDGIHLEAQTGSVFSVTDSLVGSNASDGLFVQNAKGCTGLSNSVSGAVSGSRFIANGDDGIEIGGTGTGCTPPNFTAIVNCGLLGNTIVGNGDYGIVETTSSSSFHCGVGVNMISYNVTGAESGTGGVCTSLSTSQNQVNLSHRGSIASGGSCSARAVRDG